MGDQKNPGEEASTPEPLENGVHEAEDAESPNGCSRVRRNLESAKKLDEHHRRISHEDDQEDGEHATKAVEERRHSTSSYVDGLRGKLLEHIDVEEEKDRENLHAARAYVNWVTGADPPPLPH